MRKTSLLFSRLFFPKSAPIIIQFANMASTSFSVQLSEEEWKKRLTPEEYAILRKKDTEYPNTGEYNKTSVDGLYKCRGCKAVLYTSSTKFDSGCGWPAFWAEIPGSVYHQRDADGRRIEIMCQACGGHLGHVFHDEGYDNPVNSRHCVNSRSLVLDKNVSKEELDKYTALILEKNKK